MVKYEKNSLNYGVNIKSLETFLKKKRNGEKASNSTGEEKLIKKKALHRIFKMKIEKTANNHEYSTEIK